VTTATTQAEWEAALEMLAAAGDARLRHRGRALVGWMFTLALSAYNLTRLKTLAVQAA
jgi:hypothetical protein